MGCRNDRKQVICSGSASRDLIGMARPLHMLCTDAQKPSVLFRAVQPGQAPLRHEALHGQVLGGAGDPGMALELEGWRPG